MTEAILLGTVAIRVPGQRLEWDHARKQFKQLTEATRFLQRTYRDGWHVAHF